MGTMSYCLFESTYEELLECQHALVEEKELSAQEEDYKNKLITLCREICEEFGGR